MLAAYPDPKTSRPLIGAGFSLDVEVREHLQNDPLNPNQFLEPSSAQLWQAAGLDAERLQAILEQFDRNLAKWSKKTYRKKVKSHQLKPQLTKKKRPTSARVGVQSTHNAKAYCRNYDQLTASQQMALSQLVFQMGVNLEEFLQFLAVLNDDPLLQNVVLAEGDTSSQDDKWKAVQQTLIDSQWARRYRSRAVTVIAMFDPPTSKSQGSRAPDSSGVATARKTSPQKAARDVRAHGEERYRRGEVIGDVGPAVTGFAILKKASTTCSDDGFSVLIVRGSGEIGRHTILRGWRRKAWGFKSPLPHHRLPHSGSKTREVNLIAVWAAFECLAADSES